MRRSAPLLLVLLLGVLPAGRNGGGARAATSQELGLEAGVIARLYPDSPPSILPAALPGSLLGSEIYAEPMWRLQTEDGSGVATLSFRARSLDREHSMLEIRDSYLSMERGPLRGRLGFQSISWGETFGFFIADLANPREWRDPLLLDVAFSKKPVFMGRLQWFGRESGADLFVTPVTRSSGDAGGVPEAGARFSRLWDWGLDSSWFVASHQERAPGPKASRATSTGLTASQALGSEWVLRTDQVWTGGPWEWRGVLGADWAPPSGFSLGAQLHRDPLEWGSSLRVAWKGFREVLDFEAFGYLSRGRLWLQPKVTYSHPGGISVSVRYDLLTAWSYDRMLVWVAYRI